MLVGWCCLLYYYLQQLVTRVWGDALAENNHNHTTNVFSNLALCLACWLQMARCPASVHFNNYITGD